MYFRWTLENNDMKIEPDEVKDFFQSKSNFYRGYSVWVVALALITSVFYYISDCQMYGRIQFDTFVPRFMALIILPLFYFANKKVKDYRMVSLIENICMHLVVINTAWSIYFIPNRSHTDESFLIMQCMFLALSFSIPFSHTVISYLVFYFIDILGSNLFNHYDDLNFILSMGIPLTLGILGASVFLQRLYVYYYTIEKQLKRSSITDFLTGLYNRNYLFNFVNRLEKNIDKGACVLIYDIDHFKKVNDTYGHNAGDDILKSVAQISKDSFREEDVVTRWGGEEFVVLLLNTDLKDGEALAENLRRTVEESDNGICKITISVGVARLINYDIEKSVALADKALYAAKKAGRNNVKCNTKRKN